MSDRNPDVSLVVPLFNRSLFTRIFLLALRGSLPRQPTCEVVLVDNGSSDDTAEVLAELAGAYRVLSLPVNRNFSGGCNAGAAASRGRYLYFVNNDTVPLAGFVAALVEAVEGERAAEAAGSRLLYPDGRIQHAGLGINHVRLPTHLYHLCPGDLPAANRRRPVQAVTGASMLVRRDRFEALGGFDETYRNSFEDVDFCLRLRAAGGRILYVPESTLYHFESATEGRHDYDEENRTRFVALWHDRLEPDEARIYAADGFRLDPRPMPESAFGLHYRLEQERLAKEGWVRLATGLAADHARLAARLDAAAAAVGPPAAGGSAALLACDLPPRLEAGAPVAVRLELDTRIDGQAPGPAGGPGGDPGAAPLVVEAGFEPASGASGAADPAKLGRAPIAAVPVAAGQPCVEVDTALVAPGRAGEHALAVALVQGERRLPLGRVPVAVWPRYGAEYVAHAPARIATGSSFRLPVIVRNTGMRVWDSGGAFQLGYRWAGASGELSLASEGRCAVISERVGPDETLTLVAAIPAPVTAGAYSLELSLVEEGVAWFSKLGVPPLRCELAVEAGHATPGPLRAAASPKSPSLTRLLEERDRTLRLERIATSGRLEALRGRIDELERGVAWLQAELDVRERNRLLAAEAAEEARGERDRLHDALASEQQRRDALDRALQEIEASRLWRLLRRIRGRGSPLPDGPAGA